MYNVCICYMNIYNFTSNSKHQNEVCTKVIGHILRQKTPTNMRKDDTNELTALWLLFHSTFKLPYFFLNSLIFGDCNLFQLEVFSSSKAVINRCFIIKLF